jgi:hypothetical protein
VVQGLLSGSVDFIVDGVAASLPLIQSGRLRALAKLNGRPLPVLPDLQPLAVAAGLPELEDMSSWIGLVAPAGTPQPVVDKIAREIAAILCRSGRRGPAGAGRHHRRNHDAAGVRRVFSRRGGALDEGFSRERHQAGLTAPEDCAGVPINPVAAIGKKLSLVRARRLG